MSCETSAENIKSCGKWAHPRCVGRDEPPRGDWLCRVCSNSQQTLLGLEAMLGICGHELQTDSTMESESQGNDCQAENEAENETDNEDEGDDEKTNPNQETESLGSGDDEDMEASGAENDDDDDFIADGEEDAEDFDEEKPVVKKPPPKKKVW